MQSLPKTEYPKDFFYHRTGADTYRSYLKLCGLTTFDLPTSPQFAWVKRVFGGWFAIIKYERTDCEPDPKWLKKHLGIRHGFVAWIPYSKEKPKGWRRLLLTDHFEETGYTVLPQKSEAGKNGQPLYLRDWHERSRRARKKYLTSGATIREVTPEVFIAAFRETKVVGPHKSGSISYYKKITSVPDHGVRSWLAYSPEGKQIGGLAVLDYHTDHSVHLVAFTDRKNYAFQAGTGLIDVWFQTSLEKGIKYLSFDHLRNVGGPASQKGYTSFKDNFLTARLSFREAYFKFF